MHAHQVPYGRACKCAHRVKAVLVLSIDYDYRWTASTSKTNTIIRISIKENSENWIVMLADRISIFINRL